MKILHVNTYDSGGAFIAAYRFHKELKKQGIDSKFLVLKSKSNKYQGISFLDRERNFFDRATESILFRIFKWKLNKIKKNIPKDAGIVSIPYSPYDITKLKEYKDADLIHLHWIAGFVNYYTFFSKNKKPVVWTLHDQNPYLGLFHYEYRGKCSQKIQRLEAKLSEKKNSIIKKHKPILIFPSLWNQRKYESHIKNAVESFHIFNGLYIGKSELIHSQTSIENKKIEILFVAQNTNDPYKGFSLLLDAIRKISDDRIHLVAIGDQPDVSGKYDKIRFTGFVDDEMVLRQKYKESDIFVTPSLADNLPNTVLEAMANGLPCIGFNVGGIPEMIIHNKTGLLARKEDINDLKDKISELINDNDKRNRLGNNAYLFTKNHFDIKVQAKKYKKIYSSILEN